MPIFGDVTFCSIRFMPKQNFLQPLCQMIIGACNPFHFWWWWPQLQFHTRLCQMITDKCNPGGHGPSPRYIGRAVLMNMTSSSWLWRHRLLPLASSTAYRSFSVLFINDYCSCSFTRVYVKWLLKPRGHGLSPTVHALLIMTSSTLMWRHFYRRLASSTAYRSFGPWLSNDYFSSQITRASSFLHSSIFNKFF